MRAEHLPFRCIPRGRQYQSALDRIYHTNALTGKVCDFSSWGSILLGLSGSSLDGTISSRPRPPKGSSDLGSTTELLDRGGILFCHPKVDILSGLDGRSEVG